MEEKERKTVNKERDRGRDTRTEMKIEGYSLKKEGMGGVEGHCSSG